VTRRPRVVTFRLDQATWDWIGNGREIVEFNSAHAVSSHLIKFDGHIDVQFVCDPDII
jgi:hypothetical protein